MRQIVKNLVLLVTLLPIAGLLVLAIPEMKILLTEQRYWLGYANSLLLTVPIVIFQLAVAVLAAFALSRWRGCVRQGIYLIYCLLTLLPCQIMLLPNYLVCRSMGVLNNPIAIVLLGIFSPLPVFLLARQMQRIEWSQSEAAALDGAGEWQMLWAIYLPQVRGTLGVATVLAFLDCWSMVELPLVLLSDEGKQPLSLLLARPDFLAPYAGAAVYMTPIIVVLIVVCCVHALGRKAAA